MHTRDSLTYVLDQTVGVIFFDEMFSEPIIGPGFFRMTTSDTGSETRASMGTAGSWQKKTETQEVAEDSINQQFKKTFVHEAYGSKLLASRELVEDQKWGLVESLAMGLADGARLTMEEHAAEFFNDLMVGAKFTSEDSKAVCHTAHTNAQGSNSQSNKLTAELTPAGLQTARQAGRKLKNYRGQLTPITYNELLVPVELEEPAWEILNSTGKVGTANNDANFFNGRYTLYVWERLTDTNAFLLMASNLRRRFVEWIMRVAPETFGDGSLFAGTRRIGGYMRYSLGCTDWRWVMGCNPS